VFSLLEEKAENSVSSKLQRGSVEEASSKSPFVHKIKAQSPRREFQRHERRLYGNTFAVLGGKECNKWAEEPQEALGYVSVRSKQLNLSSA
jgi:hypothetical protein